MGAVSDPLIVVSDTFRTLPCTEPRVRRGFEYSQNDVGDMVLFCFSKIDIDEFSTTFEDWVEHQFRIQFRIHTSQSSGSVKDTTDLVGKFVLVFSVLSIVEMCKCMCVDMNMSPPLGMLLLDDQYHVDTTHKRLELWNL